ncbi:glycosyltransferase family 4 protein [uncultured Polaribacter sp.]|uniref:glycosyltransferase family 4 protein n=1 Tax=uncultured Polaribacter sp. TaxID=174711 RepID=UPI002630373A|nr:glycosyltransferase family 4 protein [uncultured Polaribacter sp.]
MKILLIHNKYGKFSGEEAVAEAQLKVLEENGHQVITYFRSSEEIETMNYGKAKAFFLALKNNQVINDVTKILETEKPDIVHIHNLYPLISPAILPVIKKRNIPIVMTIHNYRLLCPNGLFFTNDSICEKCTGALKEINCITNNCEGSMFKSVGYALRNFWARTNKQYINNVDSFMCLTQFQKNKLVKNGFDANKCDVIPNFYTKDIEDEDVDFSTKSYVAFAGRISPEKGIPVLLDAARKLPNIPFQIAGLMRAGYEKFLNVPPNVTFRGMLNSDEMEVFYKKAKFYVHTSKCYEGFAMVFPEAMSKKLPIIAPNFSFFPEAVKEEITGLLYKQGDSNDLANKIESLFYNKEKIINLGRNGFERVSNKYDKVSYYNMVLNVYNKVINPQK